MEAAEYTILFLNLVFGFGFAYPVARQLAGLQGKAHRIRRYFLLLIGFYFIECIAFSAGMASNVFSIGLALVWGIVFGLWLRRSRASEREIVKGVFLFSLYSSLPAVSVLSIPIITHLSGWPILGVDAGRRFGIPEFIPFPVNTILGFCLLVAMSALIFKTLITTGTVSLFLRSRKIGSPSDE